MGQEKKNDLSQTAMAIWPSKTDSGLFEVSIYASGLVAVEEHLLEKGLECRVPQREGKVLD